MRSRRLPLGSPSRKDRSGGSESAAPVATAAIVTSRSSNSNSNSSEVSRVRTRQAPPAHKDSSSNSTNKRPRRSLIRGLPLTTSASQHSNNAKAPPEVQPVSHDDPKSNEEVVVDAVVVDDGEDESVSSDKKPSVDEIVKPKPTISHDVPPKIASSKVRSVPKPNSSFALLASRPDGSEIKMKVRLNDKDFTLDGKTAKPVSKKDSLGKDGNQFNCENCGEFGDVVCCDGCPRVYHPECLPDSHPSSRSLSNDEEPWFCPSCSEEQKEKSIAKKPRNSTSSTHTPDPVDSKASFDHDESHQCDACGKSSEMPYYDEKGNTLCSDCFANGADGEEPQDDGDSAASAEQEDELGPSKRSERKRKASYAEDDEREKQPAKKKKKKKKVHRESTDTTPEPEPDSSPIPIPGGAMQAKPGIAQATPAFYFYLVENKGKIERVLARRHRNFNRLGKAGEKNALIAKEAAIWWSRLRPPDQKRYINMSMRDFEGRIIEWKEDKSIREMTSNGGMAYDHAAKTELQLQEEDEQLTWKRHQRLYLSTSVGSKPFKPEPDQAYNRVLQDLLHDIRFHPLPMLSTGRPAQEEEKDDTGTKVLIPYFDVHGPASTSVGDACMGCMRSWNHFCPVLQRRVPAVEHRARLQPPVSSLLATRVGLGLRPHLTRPVEQSEIPDDEPELLVWRKSRQRQDLMNLPIVPSSTLNTPNERMDDIVSFVEETTAMKVPEPSRPEINQKTQLRSLPLQAPKPEESLFKKCGRCRAIIQGDTGCVQCRRAQLVINMAKRQKQEGKLLKVHTSMLGRYNTKEPAEPQSEADEAVSAAMLKERWTPTAVLPAEPKYAPHPSNRNRQALRRNEEENQDHNQANKTTERSTGDREVEWRAAGNNTEAAGQGDRESRARPSRVPTVSQDVFEPHERQEIMEKNRKAVNVFQKKIVLVACAGMLQALVRRDPLKLFDQPVSDEGYYEVIKAPMFFCNMREKLLNGQYSSLGGFSNDVKQLCDNAQVYNPPSSIYAKTAVELQEQYGIMQKRSSHWITALKEAYSHYLNSGQGLQKAALGSIEEDVDEAFADLRDNWPEAYHLLKHGEVLKKHAAADFVRTEENEIAFFGSLAVSRVAAAAEASLAPYTDVGGSFGVVSQRSCQEDKELREHVDASAASIVGPLNMSTPSTWREESVHRLLRKVQSRRLDRITASEQGCARCDGLIVDKDVMLNMKAEAAVGKVRKNEDSDLPRVDGSRIDLTTGRASANLRAKICERRKESPEEQYESVMNSCVSVRGSRIHGLGLFADQEFKKGDVVAEYFGEYIRNEEFEAREAIYRENRTQDYSFRINSDISKIVSGTEPNPHLKRVMIVASRTIKINEEITYDYQFPLEQDLLARIPCNCRSDDCRGFMNWDLPEKGANNRAVLVQKRGANMRDRIRRLNRPLKRDEL
ncbi:hypothetical protein ACA910_015431 [Epithemia clementina (nom. ined.)]